LTTLNHFTAPRISTDSTAGLVVSDSLNAYTPRHSIYRIWHPFFVTFNTP